jgi:hypothetical protein
VVMAFRCAKVLESHHERVKVFRVEYIDGICAHEVVECRFWYWKTCSTRATWT